MASDPAPESPLDGVDGAEEADADEAGGEEPPPPNPVRLDGVDGFKALTSEARLDSGDPPPELDPVDIATPIAMVRILASDWPETTTEPA